MDNTSVAGWVLPFRPEKSVPNPNHEQGRTSLWPIGSHSREISPNSIVFFWEIDGSDFGSLRGWGTPAELNDPSSDSLDSGIRVTEKVWLADAIPSRRVEQHGGLESWTLTELSKENVRAIPGDQVARIGALFAMRQRPPIVDPSGMDGGPRGKWLSRVARLSGVSHFSDAAADVLRRAAQVAPTKPRSISTTRLLLACLEFASSEALDDQSIDAGMQSLGSLIDQDSVLRQAAERLRSKYLESSPDADRSAEQVSVTDNATAVLKRAVTISREAFGRPEVSADALLAAVVRLQHGRALRQSKTAGLSMDGLQRDLLESIERTRPAMLYQWTKAFADEPKDDEGSIGPGVASTTDDPETEPYQITVAGHGNDDPWRAGLEDQLGADDEARAFARFAAAKGLNPPLAVGVFGDWGAGKSFFLKLVYKHIERLAKGEAPESDPDVFHANVVQIRFNAWHYVDTNLWASLVDHVFVELDQWIRKRSETSKADQLFDNLTTARELMFEAACRLVAQRKERKSVVATLGTLEVKLETARQEASSSLGGFWKAVTGFLTSELKSKGMDGELSKVAKALGLDQTAGDAEALQRALVAAKDEGRRGALIANALFRQSRSPLLLVLIVLGCVAVPTVLIHLKDLLVDLTHLQFLTKVKDYVIAVSGMLTAIAATVGLLTKRAHGLLTRLESFEGTLRGAIDKQVEEQSKNLSEAEKELASLTAQVDEAKARLASASVQLAAAESEFSTGTGRGRLMQFVRERATGREYSQHLGLVATIRRDFEELSESFGTQSLKSAESETASSEEFRARVDALKISAAGELEQADIDTLDKSTAGQPRDSQTRFDRIVLYIDDLDRCTPDKVVDVLQAVHLLMTFPLFVVFVAVDVRWVTQALEAHYAGMLRVPGTGPGRSAATAHDYLEKIFQIPYWVRPMTPETSAQFLEDRYKGAVATSGLEPRQPPAVGPNVAVNEPVVDPPHLVTSEDSGVDPNSSGKASTPAATTTLTTALTQPTQLIGSAPLPAGSMTSARRSAAVLALTPKEIEFMKVLSPYVGESPRRALRFLNVYRVIKASLTDQGLAALRTDGCYRLLMSQVAVITGAPSTTSKWLQAIDECGQSDFPTLFARLTSEAIGTPNDLHMLLGAMQLLVARNIGHTPANVRVHARLAARYSFQAADHSAGVPAGSKTSALAIRAKRGAA